MSYVFIEAVVDFSSDAEENTDFSNNEMASMSEDGQESDESQELLTSFVIPPKLTVQKKVLWTSQEKAVVKKVFHKHLSEGNLPNLRECCEAIRDNPELRQRSPQAVKTWISSQFKKTPSTNESRKFICYGFLTLS